MVVLVYWLCTLHDQPTFISLEVDMITLIIITSASTMPRIFPIMRPREYCHMLHNHDNSLSMVHGKKLGN